MGWRFSHLAMVVALLCSAASGAVTGAEGEQDLDAWFSGHGTAANAQGKQNFDAESLYQSSCSPCHGVSGDGRGPLAESLGTKVPALNNLAERYSGLYFPERFLIEVIDGRRNLGSHVKREMPIWSERFGLVRGSQAKGVAAAAADAAARQKIEALVEYIRSIQIR
ncbi:MAG: c-type cytochrome [Pseudomonadota bacterium]